MGDGPERSRIESLCKDFGIQKEVCFLGKQDSIAEIVSSCDVFLLPSQTESFGLAALEAMSCGVPVIATRTGGLPELVRQGENGFLSEIGDVEDMSKHALQILTDQGLRETLSKGARDTALERFQKAIWSTRMRRIITGF